jgi:proline iminopeptidase
LIDGLFTRAVGAGPAIIVLHGGPDFDHRYLLPDMDRLADSFRLIYYDNRSRSGVAPECVRRCGPRAEL